MKRIVILCDGTWNEPTSATPTNVVRIAQLMRPVADDGRVQIPIYVPGVGTGAGATKVSATVDKWFGGAFGWGLYRNVVEAYRQLVFAYVPGDEIYIFGFSRGAFTARSLAGLLRSTGIIPRDRLEVLPDAVNRYKDKSEEVRFHPDSDESHAHRLKMSPKHVTSTEENAWRRREGVPEGALLRIKYLGVWDTVGALGVPSHLSLGFNARRYRFHDAKLSAMVQGARHAVAIDERRKAYPPTHWDRKKLKLLNGGAPPEDALYQERHFVGDHGSIGGGGELTHLSSIALAWVIEGARRAGLGFDEDALAAIADEHDILGSLHNRRKPPGRMHRLTGGGYADRAGPANEDETHATVFDRWAATEGPPGFAPYRPRGLAGLETAFAARRAGDGSGARIA